MRTTIPFLLVALAFPATLPRPLTAQEDASDLRTRFTRLDRNGDGRVSPEEAGDRAALVRAADRDGSGNVTIDELLAFLKERNDRLPTPDPSAKANILVGEIPPAAPITEAGCRAAGDYSAARNGYSFLVMLEGRVVFERYDQGWTPETAHRLASGTKSFSGALLAAAVQDELLTLDEPLATTLPEWRQDARLAAITYRQLLSLTSGIDPGGIGRVPSYRDAVTGARPRQSPGEKFAYGPNPYQVFGEALRRKLEAREDLAFADPLAYLDNRVFEPIGMGIADWKRDTEGMPNLPSGAWLTAREWAKFGEFLRLEGNWKGKALVDPDTLAACLQGSDANPGYGLTFWLLDKAVAETDGTPGLEDGRGNEESDRGFLRGAYMAAGAGKQRLYILPEQNLVVVRQGESRNFEDEVLLDRLLKKASSPGSQKPEAITPAPDPSR